MDQPNINSTEMTEELNDRAKKKNIIGDVEFAEFLPLYNKKLAAKLTKEQKTELSVKFCKRFSIFDTITIIDASGKFVVSLPAPANRVPTINMPATPTDINALDAFVGVSTSRIGHPAQIQRNIDRVGAIVIETAKKALTTKSNEMKIENSQRYDLIDRFNKTASKANSTDAVEKVSGTEALKKDQVNIDDFEWD